MSVTLLVVILRSISVQAYGGKHHCNKQYSGQQATLRLFKVRQPLLLKLVGISHHNYAFRFQVFPETYYHIWAL